jgi:hypothetical protein
VNALPAFWLSTPKRLKSSLLLLTASSAFRVIALRKASTLFGLEEGLGQCLGRALAVSFTGKKQRKLEDHVERDESSDITSRQQRGLTLTGQPGKSQGGATITVGLPIRTPKRPQAPLPLPPSSTAPLTLDDSLSKRKRRATEIQRRKRRGGCSKLGTRNLTPR